VAALRSDLARARDLFASVVAVEPRNVDALAAFGSVFLQLGNPKEARRNLSEALRWGPGRPDIVTALGLAELGCGNAAEAERLCREAVRLAPGWADAHNNLGYVLRMLGRDGEAAAACRAALALAPDHTEALVNLGLLAQERRAFDEARSHFERALSSRPNHPEARFGLAEANIRSGRLAEGRALLAALIAENPRNWRARWASLVSFPIVYASQQELDSERRRFAEELDSLSRDVEAHLAEDLPRILEAVGFSTNFHLHYTGGNVRPLQERYGRLLARIAHAAYPQSAQPERPARPRDGRIRIGFASSFLYRHSVMKSHGRWITDLPRDRFDVVVFQLGGPSDATTEALKATARWVDCSALTQAQLIARIAAEALDVLIWLDIGMDAKAQVPAAVLLAPVQATGFGHPVTSGLPTIDAYLTGDLMEPAGGEAHYTEKLVRLPNLSVSYPRTDLVPGELPDAIRRLKDDGRTIYLCAQSLFKLTPVQDDAFARIAAEVPDAALVFIAHASPLATEVLHQRLSVAFAARGVADDRIVFLPRLSEAAFLAVNRAADIVLDSFEWSGFNSTLEALAMGTPVVAKPGDTMRAHHSYGILTMAGLDALIAADDDAYVALAVRLGTDAAFRERMRALVRERAGRLFDDPKPVAALADWIARAVGESGAQA
jgi:predicted O-linked N-acetylglucosamine transferase (SPINDLY family)